MLVQKENERWKKMMKTSLKVNLCPCLVCRKTSCARSRVSLLFPSQKVTFFAKECVQQKEIECEEKKMLSLTLSISEKSYLINVQNDLNIFILWNGLFFFCWRDIGTSHGSIVVVFGVNPFLLQTSCLCAEKDAWLKKQEINRVTKTKTMSYKNTFHSKVKLFKPWTIWRKRRIGKCIW